VEGLLESGIDEIWTIDGRRVTEGAVTFRPEKSPKACPINGKTVLFVDERDGTFVETKRD
jgi:hypothetical protein